MTDYHVAVDHLTDGDQATVTTSYLGTVDQAHVDEVRAIAALEDSPRCVKDHPHIDGAFCVLRDDGDLDVYVPTDAAEYRVYEPDPTPKGVADRVQAAVAQANRGETKDLGDFSQYADDEEPDSAMPRGASGPSYISGVTRLGDQSIGGAMDYPGNPPRAVWHTTESPAGASYFSSIGAYLIRVASEPQVIYDPVSDKLGQYGPLTQSGRALKNDGSRRTNREGKVCIQVEVLGRAASPWTKGFDPAKKPNFRKLLAAMRAHGIPDVWPAGKPKATAAEVARTTRSRSTWQSKGGHFSHGQVPGQSHWDPGAIDTSIVPGKASGSSSPSTPPATSTSIVPKSRESAATVLKQQAAALKNWPFIPTVEKAHGLPTGLLFAVGSRETNLTNKTGDGGHGRGVWQRDDRWWPIPDDYATNVRQQAEDAATLLAANHKALGDWGPAIAAYNAGLTGVQNAIKAGKSPDSVTAGKDYAADVLGRLAHLKAASSDSGSSSATSYTVKKGDTLTSIAKAHGTTVSKLVSLNKLKDADQLAVGQKLKLSGTTSSTPAYEPFPGAAFFHGGRHSPIITALGRRLVALGFGRHYKSGPGPNWTNADRENVRDFQKSRADLKGDADGIPGPKTWAALKVPKV